MTPADILDSAKAAVTGPRNDTHGSFDENFATIGQLWSIYLKRRGPGPLDPADVAWMMVLMKVARRVNGSAHEDHAVDAAGYAALAGALESV